ncbi:MAG TPA: hypothetical protein VGI00_24435 [Streptosporangiaceae bacterium]|jgi:hypothetical protein
MTMLLTERWPRLTADAADSSASESGIASGSASGSGATAQELLSEMAALIRDTRPYLIVSSTVAAAVLIGLAVESTTWPVSRPGPGAVAVTALFAVVALCLLRTLALIVLAGLPLGHALSQQRVSAGAPLDPRAPWASVPPPEAIAEPWGWTRAHLLLSQARFRADRIQAATNWALITAAAFLACTATTLLAR